MENKPIIVVGGGPGGMMAAITAAQRGASVLLIEKNSSLGKKLRITGGSRCNITNIDDPTAMIQKIVTNGRFMHSALNQFSSQDLMNLLRKQGVALKVEEEGRVFPKADQAQVIIDALEGLLRAGNVKILYGRAVKEILVEDGQVQGVLLEDGKALTAKSVVLATGGASYPGTGSTGEGYQMAKKLGHTIVPIKPALVAMEIGEAWIKEWMGISLEAVVIYAPSGKKKPYVMTGPLLFTHFGISGPGVLKLSSYLTKNPLPERVTIDLLPTMSQEEIGHYFGGAGKNMSNRQMKTLLGELLPKGMAPGLLEQCGIDPQLPFHQLRKEQKQALIERLKALPLTLKGLRGLKEAIITSGGVSVKEITPQTMASKLVKGLYFAGEVMDVDALTGGYNLQIAFSTGYVAGKHC